MDLDLTSRSVVRAASVWSAVLEQCRASFWEEDLEPPWVGEAGALLPPELWVASSAEDQLELLKPPDVLQPPAALLPMPVLQPPDARVKVLSAELAVKMQEPPAMLRPPADMCSSKMHPSTQAYSSEAHLDRPPPCE